MSVSPAVVTCTTCSACSKRIVCGAVLQSCSGSGGATSVRPSTEEESGLPLNQREAVAHLWHRCVCVCDSERRYVSALTQHEMIEVCSKIQQAPS